MSIAGCMIWGIFVFAAMVVTIKYYLPKLYLRTLESTAKNSEDLEETASDTNHCADDEEVSLLDGETTKKNLLFGKKKNIILILSTLFAMLCGYMAAEQSVSVISFLKMTAAFTTLACIFITDLELMIIPNLCSLILIGGRLFTVVFEFILVPDKALIWLVNSIIALIISAVVLIVISKLTKGGIGYGDVKIFISLGFLCGIRAVCFTLLFSFLLCALVSAGLLVTRKKGMKDALPLGPFIWLGFGVSVILAVV